MVVAFRNVDFDVEQDVSTWPYEAIVTVIERGLVGDWARLTRSIGNDPWGPVARRVERYLSYERPWGVAPLLDRALARSRRRAELAERAEAAATVRDLVTRSGLSMSDFAMRTGTSRSRLSTYRSGAVVPSAALMVRMTRVADRESPSGAGNAAE